MAPSLTAGPMAQHVFLILLSLALFQCASNPPSTDREDMGLSDSTVVSDTVVVPDAPSADTNIDALPPFDARLDVPAVPECTPGLCHVCSEEGPMAPADDGACGPISCSALNGSFVRGDDVVTRTYADIGSNRCASLGVCVTATEATCTEFIERITTCDGVCEEARPTGCSPRSDGTTCGSETTDHVTSPRLCFDGTCAHVCWINSGAASCSTLCGNRGMGWSCIGSTPHGSTRTSRDCGNVNGVCYGF